MQRLDALFRAQSGKLGPNSASPQFPPPKLNYLAATSRQVRPGLDLAAGFRLGILFRPKTAARRNLVYRAFQSSKFEKSETLSGRFSLHLIFAQICIVSSTIASTYILIFDICIPTKSSFGGYAPEEVFRGQMARSNSAPVIEYCSGQPRGKMGRH